MAISKVSITQKLLKFLTILVLPTLILVNLIPFFSDGSTIKTIVASFSIPFSSYLGLSTLLAFVMYYEKQVDSFLYNLISFIGSFIFSFYLILGQIYNQESQFYSPYHTSIYFLFFVIKIIATTFLVNRLISLVYWYTKVAIGRCDSQPKDTLFNFGKSWVLLLICWLPYLFIIYPASSNPDTSNQIAEFFGQGYWVRDIYPIGHYLLGAHPFSISNQHNFFVTIFYGVCVKLGLIVFHSVNVGLFFAAIIQLVILSLILTYSLSTFKKINVDMHTITIIENFYRFFPLFPIYSIYLVKNVLYSSFVVWFMCLILQLIKYPSKLEDRRWQFLLVLSLIGQLITQKYAFAVLSLTAVLFLVIYRKQYKIIILTFLVPLLLFRICIEGLMFNVLEVPKGDPIEGQGIMIQQTALCVKDHADTINHEEYKALNKVFVVKNMKKVYTPEQTDGIKSSGANGKMTVYRWKTVTRKDLKRYHRVWLRMAFKYPGTYIEAALHLGYRYLDINSPSRNSDWHIYSDSLPVTTNAMYLDLGKQVHQNQKFLRFRKLLVNIYNVLIQIPPFGFLAQGSFYIWLTVFILLYGIYISIDNWKNMLLLGSNLLLQVPIYLMAPIDNDSRYFLPFIFSIGILIVLPKMLTETASKV